MVSVMGWDKVVGSIFPLSFPRIDDSKLKRTPPRWHFQRPPVPPPISNSKTGGLWQQHFIINPFRRQLCFPFPSSIANRSWLPKATIWRLNLAWMCKLFNSSPIQFVSHEKLVDTATKQKDSRDTCPVKGSVRKQWWMYRCTESECCFVSS